MHLQRLFTEHPATVGETYWQHFRAASSFAIRLFAAAFCCSVHAVFPFLFEKTGSRMITVLHDRMVTNRSRLNAANDPLPEQAAEKARAAN